MARFDLQEGQGREHDEEQYHDPDHDAKDQWPSTSMSTPDCPRIFRILRHACTFSRCRDARSHRIYRRARTRSGHADSRHKFGSRHLFTGFRSVSVAALPAGMSGHL